MAAMHEKGYTHYGWLLSPFSAKSRAFLHFKQIQFTDRSPSALQLYYSMIKPAVGRAIMPTVRTPDGEWLQDSTVIMDEFEKKFPLAPSTTPPGPTQRLASELLEIWADEWFTIVALHFRWNVADNKEWAIGEFGRVGFPYWWLPESVTRRLVAPVADSMQKYRPIVGITRSTIPGIEAFTTQLITQLETHLCEYPFLLGFRPCRGDFALSAPLWAHLYRDPYTRYLFAKAPYVIAWLERVQGSASKQQEKTLPNSDTVTNSSILHAEVNDISGEKRTHFLGDDLVPHTLDDIFRSLFRDFGAFLVKIMGAVDAYLDTHPGAKRVPRVLGEAAFTIGGAHGTKKMQTFTHWKAQRAFFGSQMIRQKRDDAFQHRASNMETWLRRVEGLEVMSKPPKWELERSHALPMTQEVLEPVGIWSDTPEARL